jgi:hypothetical protein
LLGNYTSIWTVFLTAFLLALLIVWKGGSSKIDLTDAQSVGVSFGVGGAVAASVTTFVIPLLYRRILKEDWELKGWEVIKGPLLFRRPEPPPKPEGLPGICDFYAGHFTAEELEAKRAAQSHVAPDDIKWAPLHPSMRKAMAQTRTILPSRLYMPDNRPVHQPINSRCPRSNLPRDHGVPPPSLSSGSDTAPSTVWSKKS